MTGFMHQYKHVSYNVKNLFTVYVFYNSPIRIFLKVRFIVGNISVYQKVHFAIMLNLQMSLTVCSILSHQAMYSLMSFYQHASFPILHVD